MKSIVSRVSRRHFSCLSATSRFRVTSVASNKFFFSTEATSLNANNESIQFKAEVAKLLKIVTHSLYTDKEVFVRELVSNASDALEKLRFLQASGKADIQDVDLPLQIVLSCDPESKTVTIEDSGLGMTREQLIDNLGTIAKSGSLEFLQSQNLAQGAKDNTLLGQFGVGFYSAFVVSDNVEVFTRSFQVESKGYHWMSDGENSYSIREVEGLPRGTKIVCHLREGEIEFANHSKIEELAKKFSSFISFPLKIKDDKGENEIGGGKGAVWLKQDATPDELLECYRHLAGSHREPPHYSFLYQSDSPLSLKAAFFIPPDPPSRLFSPSRGESNISLYSRRVLVSKNEEALVPKWLSFLYGVIDCEDMPMNISREGMQDSTLMKKLREVIVRKVLRFLKDESKKNPDSYKTFYLKYAQNIKEGLLDDLHHDRRNTETISKLLMYESSDTAQDKLVSLEEYLEGCHEKQKNIYFLSASSRKIAEASPYLEQFKARGIPVLFFLEDIDDFVAMHLGEFKGKKIISVDDASTSVQEDLSLISPAPPSSNNWPNLAPLSEAQKETLKTYAESVLGKQVSGVTFNDDMPCMPAMARGQLPLALRKMMKATMQETGQSNFAESPLSFQLNPSHGLIRTIYELYASSHPLAAIAIKQVFYNAKVAAASIDDARELLPQLNEFLEGAVKNIYDVTCTLKTNSQQKNIMEEHTLILDGEEILEPENLNEEEIGMPNEEGIGSLYDEELEKIDEKKLEEINGNLENDSASGSQRIVAA